MIGIVLYFTLFKKTGPQELSINELVSRIQLSANDDSDKIYFESIVFNPFKNEITTLYVKDTTRVSYITYGKLVEVKEYLSEPNKAILDALKSGSNSGYLTSVSAPEQSIFVSILISLIPTILIVIVLW
ncbi:Uncharacterised protein, partial [Mycoplasmopsis edwardii]